MNNANDSQLYFPTFSRLWRSTDRGNNWYPVSRTYGNQMADITIACNHKPDPIVYWTNSDSVFILPNAATALPNSEFGIYITMDKGLTWTKELGMPNVQIREIKIRETDKKVFIFTYGRGTWTADFATLLSVQAPKISNVSVFPNPFNEQFTITFEKELNAVVDLTDLQGMQCLRKAISGREVFLQTEKLVPGMYVITVTSDNEVIYQTKGIRISN